MKTNLVCTLKVYNKVDPKSRIEMLLKDVNSHAHCNIEAHTMFLENDVFEIKVSSEKHPKLGCTPQGFCYNRKRILAKSLIDSLLSTPFYCDIEIIKEGEYYEK